jgi:transglutaminase-like putative cysteine protease
MTTPSSARATLDTRFCDYRHPDVQSLAATVAENADDPRDLALQAFEHVRDHIVFGLDLWQVSASETLRKGYGMCSNKALLLVAVLRQRGVPARLAWVPMLREALAPAVGKMIYTLPRALNHVIAEVQLDDEWIPVDLTLDRETFEALYRPAGVAWDIDWNGVDDCLIFNEHIAGDVTSCPDIDATLAANADNVAPPKIVAAPAMRLANELMWRSVRRKSGR